MRHKPSHRAHRRHNISNPKCSIIIPNWNKGRELGEALDSWYAQTEENWEMVIVDDGSTQEEDHAILDSIKDSRVKVIKLRKNRGQSRARNIGEGVSETDILLRADADDLALPNRIELTLECMNAFKDCTLFYASYWERTENYQKFVHAVPFDMSRLIETGLFYIGVCTIAHRKCHRHSFETPLGRRTDDWMFQYNAVKRGAKMCFIDEPVTIYRATQERVDRYSPGENRERLLEKKRPYLEALA